MQSCNAQRLSAAKRQSPRGLMFLGGGSTNAHVTFGFARAKYGSFNFHRLSLTFTVYLDGKSFSNFSMALFRFFSFFSWLPLGLMVLVAVPCQTNCLEAGSYMSRTRLPTLIVDCVADPMPPPKPLPVPQAFHCFSRSSATW